MAGTNNFVTFDSAGTNMTSDANYPTNAAVLNGLTNGIADPALISKALHQGTIMAAALASLLAAAGANVSDADVNLLASQITALFPVPGSSAPLMDSAAAIGTSAAYARADHVHPTDTSRAAQADMTAAQASIAAHQSALNDLAVWAAMGGM